jgi:hypothetical protein
LRGFNQQIQESQTRFLCIQWYTIKLT